MSLPVLIVWGVLTYLAVGVLFAVPFALVGVKRVDPVASGAPVYVRAIFVPGAVALWPILLVRWVRSPRSRESAHEGASSEGVSDGA